ASDRPAASGDKRRLAFQREQLNEDVGHRKFPICTNGSKFDGASGIEDPLAPGPDIVTRIAETGVCQRHEVLRRRDAGAAVEDHLLSRYASEQRQIMRSQFLGRAKTAIATERSGTVREPRSRNVASDRIVIDTAAMEAFFRAAVEHRPGRIAPALVH